MQVNNHCDLKSNRRQEDGVKDHSPLELISALIDFNVRTVDMAGWAFRDAPFSHAWCDLTGDTFVTSAST